jgi:hypothetical protein
MERLRKGKAIVLGLVLAGALATAATAQAPVIVRVRGEVESLSGGVLTLKSPAGETLHVKLADKVAVVALVKANVGAIKSGSYIAISSEPNAAGVQQADEVMVFLESGRGTAEGQFPWDQGKNTLMTNAGISGEVQQADGRELTLTPKGKTVKVLVPSSAVVVQQEVADTALLVPGAQTFFGAMKAADGSLSAGKVYVGKGCAPSKTWVHCK